MADPWRTVTQPLPELTADAGEVRGTDGGVADCGGDPQFYQWLVRATAFRDRAEIERASARSPGYPSLG